MNAGAPTYCVCVFAGPSVVVVVGSSVGMVGLPTGGETREKERKTKRLTVSTIPIGRVAERLAAAAGVASVRMRTIAAMDC
jgi:hypothetical protein